MVWEWGQPWGRLFLGTVGAYMGEGLQWWPCLGLPTLWPKAAGEPRARAAALQWLWRRQEAFSAFLSPSVSVSSPTSFVSSENQTDTCSYPQCPRLRVGSV